MQPIHHKIFRPIYTTGPSIVSQTPSAMFLHGPWSDPSSIYNTAVKVGRDHVWRPVRRETMPDDKRLSEKITGSSRLGPYGQQVRAVGHRAQRRRY